MSDLQITLIALGAIIILCVLLYNGWQERKFRLNMASSFKEPKRDVLIDDFEINTYTIKINADAFDNKQARQPVKPSVAVEIATQSVASIVVEAPLELVENMVTAIEEQLEEQFIEPLDLAPLPIEQPDSEAATFDDDAKVEVALDQVASTETNLMPMIEGHELDLEDAWGRDAEQSPILEESVEAPEMTAQMAPKAEPVAEILVAKMIVPAPINLPDSINQKIDLIALITLEKDLGQDALNYALNEWLEVVCELDKPAYVFGLTADGAWHLMANDRNLTQSYIQLSLSLQLADRGGAISKANLNRFQHAVELLGLTLGYPVEWLNNSNLGNSNADNANLGNTKLSNSSLEFAQQLDQFCIEVDKIIGFHLVQGESGAFHGTKLRGLAEANGFSLGKDGAFHYSFNYSEPNTKEPNNSELNTQANTDNMPLFTIIHQNNQLFTADSLRNIVIKGITFQMDIPRVKNCAEAFKQMVAIAQKMQISLGAHLVDDNQKPLSALQLDKICQQIEGIQTTMLNYGIASGSPTALRLFV